MSLCKYRSSAHLLKLTSLVSPHPNGDGDPPKTFDRENLKFGLKSAY